VPLASCDGALDYVGVGQLEGDDWSRTQVVPGTVYEERVSIGSYGAQTSRSQNAFLAFVNPYNRP
jgi:hypothetical protein